jgi:hypothetical protein
MAPFRPVTRYQDVEDRRWCGEGWSEIGQRVDVLPTGGAYDMKCIIGIDPGRTTGYVEALHNNGDLRVLEAREIVWNDRMVLIPLIADTVSKDPQVPTVVVVESFRLYPHEFHHQVGSSFPSVHIIGIVDVAVWLTGKDVPIIYQPASIKSRTQVLDSLPRSPHVRDAYRHARYYSVAKRFKE